MIVSAPVASFSQVNQAQIYVSMSRARQTMHLMTDSIAALKEAVCRPSQRESAIELMSAAIEKQCRQSLAARKNQASVDKIRQDRENEGFPFLFDDYDDEDEASGGHWHAQEHQQEMGRAR